MKKSNLTYKVDIKLCGFTITELLMVVVLIGLIGSVGSVLYVGSYKRMLVEKAAGDIVLAAKYARIMAIEKQKPYRLEFDTENNGFQIIYAGFDEQTQDAQLATVRDLYFKPVQFSGEVVIEDIQNMSLANDETQADNEQNKGVVFFPNGTAQSAVIQVGDGQNHCTVSIAAATGKAKMQAGIAENIEFGTVDLEAQQ